MNATTFCLVQGRIERQPEERDVELLAFLEENQRLIPEGSVIVVPAHSEMQ